MKVTGGGGVGRGRAYRRTDNDTMIRYCRKLQNSVQNGSAFVKSFVKENNDSNKTWRYVHEFLLASLHLSKCKGSRVVSIKQNTNFNIQLPYMFVFLILQKNDLIKTCSSFPDLTSY
jgi:hypothetical protein